ncbi:MAG: diguanylate cyclase [Gammaproteobacteria bacterium]|nr:MAG: diguanylate cyclase [Gammaproteobacteria bacterium]TND07354.1 MAG: diguanylate cyclase [Gammaproteobacteria bacterium]
MSLKTESTLASKALRLLDGLTQTPEGTVVYQHIQQVLDSYDETRGEIEEGYADLLRLLLDGIARGLPDTSPEKIHLKLLQKRLAPPITVTEFIALRASIEKHAQQISASKLASDHESRAILLPVLEGLGITVSAPAEPALPVTRSANPPPAAVTVAPPAAVSTPAMVVNDAETAEPRPRDFDVPPRSRLHSPVDSAYRKHLQENRERVQRIQESLSEQVSEAVTKNEEFGVLLEVELEALRQAVDSSEVEALRQTLIDEIQKLLDGHRSLSKRLDSTKEYLQIIEHDSKQLNEELTRVHLLSLTDELTDLPNRRAFMRRLEDEVSRVQRYGSPLTVALIDLDRFKAINDKFGHPVGDEVLRAFSLNVLSIFRHHDMVARIGGEEFGVLLPNTDTKGAAKALVKVKARAAEITTDLAGIQLPMNTFSAGVAMYKPGETVSTLIERADSALYQAKRLGRDRVEVATPETTEAVSRPSQ